jgi:proteasome lid subunit RPN8/RPN11
VPFEWIRASGAGAAALATARRPARLPPPAGSSHEPSAPEPGAGEDETLGRCVEIDASEPPRQVPPRVLNEILAHARESFPEECCGLVLGDAGERFRHVVRCRNVMTQRHLDDPGTWRGDNRSGYYMSTEDQERARKQARDTGQRVTAVYHSHVGSGAYLSDMDLAYAEHPLFPFPEAAQIVVAVISDKVEGVGLFERGAPGGDFAGRRVELPKP